jgi:hypothetical protein
VVQGATTVNNDDIKSSETSNLNLNYQNEAQKQINQEETEENKIVSNDFKLKSNDLKI